MSEPACPTCGYPDTVDGDCPHCNPPWPKPMGGPGPLPEPAPSDSLIGQLGPSADTLPPGTLEWFGRLSVGHQLWIIVDLAMMGPASRARKLAHLRATHEAGEWS